MLPAEESFQPGDSSRGHFDLRLIHQKEFFPVERQSQAALQYQSLHRLSVHVLGKEPKVVTPIVLGAIHSGIGMFDQGFGVRAVLRGKC